ncbi:type I-C CRISPR-associated protein Cas8c/Csd1 [Streptomyces sp. NPDC086554]|uniref:type I-C CRISPR-associated protein Cas8c/Csd1 n=1 Tax=Streptomyces sp. NPDC086554 TaxID=3154864 RepID=UPI00342AED28
MLLQRLVEHAGRRDDLPPPYHRVKSVHWVLDVDLSGEAPAYEFVDLRPAKGESPRRIAAPDTLRTSMPLPFLLVDSAEYVLGVARVGKGADVPGEKDRKKAELRRSLYVDLLGGWAATAPDDPAVQAVVGLLSQGVPRERQPQELSSAHTVAVMVGGEWLHEHPSVAAFWAGHVQEKKARSGGFGVCLVCGEPGPLVDSLPDAVVTATFPKVDGIDKKAKAQLMSVNAPAFARAEGEQLAHTPVCAGCGSRAVAVLNALLADDRHRRPVAPSVMVWWTREPTTDCLLDALDDPQPGDVSALLDLVHKPNLAAPQFDGNLFHAVTLGLNSSRVVVRGWIDVPLPEVRRALGTWFSDVRIADPWTGALACYPLWRLTQCTGRWTEDENGRDSYVKGSVPHGVPADLLHAALHGTAPDMRILLGLLHRIRADHRIDGPRAALIRLILTRHSSKDDAPMPQLNPVENDPAYVCGRIFATLEAIQRTAMPKVNSTIADKYLGTAATSPGTVLPGLRINAGNHLRRLRRDKGAAAAALESRMNSMFALITGDLPAYMLPVQQGRFVLGYEHQRAADRAAMAERIAAKNAAEAADTQLQDDTDAVA